MALPALARAQRVGEKLAHAGFDWPDLTGVLAKLDEERGELAQALHAGDSNAAHHELGDLLLTLTSVARHLDVEAESALRDATTRLAGRVAHVERAAERIRTSKGRIALGPLVCRRSPGMARATASGSHQRHQRSGSARTMRSTS